MTQWKLSREFNTSAGRVSSGSCGNGPNLVLAHGWPWSSYSWHKVIPQLASTYRLHWYDMPGYGKSEMTPDQKTSLDVQGQVFAEMLDHWKLNKPIFAAHDFGGATTLRAHLLHGCEYERYILMNVVAMRPWGSEFFEHVGRNVGAFSALPDHIHKAVVKAYIKGALVTKISKSDLSALIAPWLTKEGRKSFYRQFVQADEKYTAEVEPLFSKIRCPVKILWGEDDPWIPIARGEALHQEIPHSTFHPLKGAGHLPQLEIPDQVISHFLE